MKQYHERRWFDIDQVDINHVQVLGRVLIFKVGLCYIDLGYTIRQVNGISEVLIHLIHNKVASLDLQRSKGFRHNCSPSKLSHITLKHRVRNADLRVSDYIESTSCISIAVIELAILDCDLRFSYDLNEISFRENIDSRICPKLVFKVAFNNDYANHIVKV